MPSVRRPDGTEIAFDVAGVGPPVLLLHGLTSDRRRWAPVSALLQPRRTCVRPDLRGHGASTLAGDVTLLAMAQDAAAVLDAVGAEAPAVVGSSLGGSVAAVLAMLRPEVAAVVVVDQPLRPSAYAPRIRALAPRLRGDGFADAMLEFEASLDLGPLPAEARAALEASVRGADPALVLALWAPLLEGDDAALDAAMAAGLAQLRAPLLCLHGSTPPPGYEGWLREHTPTAELEVWPGLGHLPHLVDPARFAERVLAFTGG